MAEEEKKIETPPEPAPAPEPAVNANIETYQKDLEEAILGGGADISRMIAEEKKGEEEKKAQTLAAPKNMIYLVGSLLFILAGIGANFWVRTLTDTGNIPEPAQTIADPSLIHPDEPIALDSSGLTSKALKEKIYEVSRANPTGEWLYAIYISKNIFGPTQSMSTADFLGAMRGEMPQGFADIFDSRYTLGTYGKTGNSAFILLKTARPEKGYFDAAFDGMREWQSKMLFDLADIWGLKATPENQSLFAAPFADEIIKNKDAKAIRDREGNLVIFYAFLSDRYILIAQDPDVVPEILNRLSSVVE